MKLGFALYFNVNKITVSDTLERDYSELDSFVVLMCLSGKATLNNVSVTKGETVFIPAVLGKIAIQAEENTEFLEVWVG